MMWTWANVEQYAIIGSALAALGGAVIMVAWWWKLRPLVEEIVSEAIGEEHTWVQEQIRVLESRKVECRAEMLREIHDTEGDLRTEMRRIADKIDQILLLLGGKK